MVFVPSIPETFNTVIERKRYMDNMVRGKYVEDRDSRPKQVLKQQYFIKQSGLKLDKSVFHTKARTFDFMSTRSMSKVSACTLTRSQQSRECRSRIFFSNCVYSWA